MVAGRIGHALFPGTILAVDLEEGHITCDLKRRGKIGMVGSTPRSCASGSANVHGNKVAATLCPLSLKGDSWPCTFHIGGFEIKLGMGMASGGADGTVLDVEPIPVRVFANCHKLIRRKD